MCALRAHTPSRSLRLYRATQSHEETCKKACLLCKKCMGMLGQNTDRLTIFCTGFTAWCCVKKIKFSLDAQIRPFRMPLDPVQKPKIAIQNCVKNLVFCIGSTAKARFSKLFAGIAQGFFRQSWSRRTISFFLYLSCLGAEKTPSLARRRSCGVCDDMRLRRHPDCKITTSASELKMASFGLRDKRDRRNAQTVAAAADMCFFLIRGVTNAQEVCEALFVTGVFVLGWEERQAGGEYRRPQGCKSARRKEEVCQDPDVGPRNEEHRPRKAGA